MNANIYKPILFIKKMVWSQRRVNDYLLTITDGYLSDEITNKELAFAFYVYSTLKWMSPAERRSMFAYIPSEAHIWVIGNNEWLNRKDDFGLKILKGETNPNYRIVIRGINHDRERLGEKFGFAAELRYLKERIRPNLESSGFDQILNPMADFYESNQIAPSKVLDDLKLPYIFHGD